MSETPETRPGPIAGDAGDAIAADEMRFSEALAELEEIVRALESGRLDLEDSISRYERGVALLKACRAKLGSAEQRIESLMGEIGDLGDIREEEGGSD